MRYLALAGRIAFSLIFLTTPKGHFTAAYVGYATQQGVPLPGLLVPFSAVVAVIGALSIILGYHTKAGAWLIVIFLVPVTLYMHRFWSVTDPMMHGLQVAMFMKNLSILGGALLIAQFGAGPVSLDARRSASL
jgi:putative oxidoreductase